MSLRPSRPLRSSASLPSRLLLTLLLLLPFVSVARAQFSGPAPVASPATNTHAPVTTDPTVLFPGERDIELLPGDQIGVHLFAATDYAPIIRISLDGSVNLPLIGVIHIAGMSIHAAERAIDQRLIDDGMYRNPQITLQLLESPNQIITVTGELHAVVPAIGGQKRLYDVIAAAGGLTPTSSHLVTINRPGVAQPIIVDLGQDPERSNLANVPVYARDTVVISRVAVVYLLGAFRQQGAIPLQPSTPLTLMQAAALGNGAGYEGKFNDLHIIRTVGLERRVLHINAQRVFQGKDPDPILQSDDIVFLPTSAMKAAIKNGGVGTAIGIVSFLIYAFTVNH